MFETETAKMARRMRHAAAFKARVALKGKRTVAELAARFEVLSCSGTRNPASGGLSSWISSGLKHPCALKEV